MVGMAILIVVFLGLRGGFTGLTYPLTIVALGLCAFGGINPLYAIAFAPLAAIHHARMQHPLLTPPVVGRIGLVPIFGAVSFVLTAVVVVRAFARV